MRFDAVGDFDPYGGAPPPDSLSAHLLVATPRLADPNFARRTVLVLDHGDHGAIGVVLDAPGGVPVREVLPQWHLLALPPAELFTGGPVARDAVVGLARLRTGVVRQGDPGTVPPDGWHPLIDDRCPVGTIDLGADPDVGDSALVGVRLFSGYAGWGPDQLEDEIDEGSWFVVPAEAHDVMSAEPERLWRRVLHRQGGALALAAGFPDDPASN